MALLIQLIAIVALVSATSGASTKYNPKNLQPKPQLQPEATYIPQLSYAVDPSFDTYQIPLNLQLPKVEAPKVPFYTPEPSGDLKAPQQYYQSPSLDLRAPQYFQNPEPNYYQLPIPSQDLKAPTETQWNPNNDPKFFYEVPAVITKQEIPTKSFPKKYNKEIHTKVKPYSYKPKQEIALKPISEKQLAYKQKNLNKAYDSLSKKENQKLLLGNKNEQVLPKKLASFTKPEPELSATGFHSGFDTEGVNHESSGGFTQGLSSELTSSLGIGPHHGERLEFHMTGHDGPHSYKWGFDTGKGHNRQFRFEEKDKEGFVKGHFGFYDKHGKLQMINYDADPLHGYHAEGNHFGKF